MPDEAWGQQTVYQLPQAFLPSTSWNKRGISQPAGFPSIICCLTETQRISRGNGQLQFHQLPPRTERWQPRFSKMLCPWRPVRMKTRGGPVPSCAHPHPASTLLSLLSCCHCDCKAHSGLSSGFPGGAGQVCGWGSPCVAGQVVGFCSGSGEPGRWAERVSLPLTTLHRQKTRTPPTSELLMLLTPPSVPCAPAPSQNALCKVVQAVLAACSSVSLF